MMSTNPIIADRLPSDRPLPYVRKRMSASFPLKKAGLCLSDLFLINAALFLALMIRDAWLPEAAAVTLRYSSAPHFVGFNILHAAWLFIFYSVGLYDLERFSSRLELAKRIWLALFVCGVIGLTIFYTLAFLKMTPKVFRMPPRTVLALDLTFLAMLLFLSRATLIRWGKTGLHMRIMVCGTGMEVTQFTDFLCRNGHLGYKIRETLTMQSSGEGGIESVYEVVRQRLADGLVDIIAVTRHVNDDEVNRAFFYRLLCAGVHVVDFSHLYEEITGKIPSSLINQGWFVGSVRAFNRRGFEVVKRSVDIIIALLLGVGFLLLFPILALAIKMESPGPIFFRQRRIGRDGREFQIHKLRTMSGPNEGHAHWAGEAEKRITPVGRFLRKTRIDELPQLWNVVKGDMSFVGPRPEWTALYNELVREIPFYDARTLVRPGLTGWAQINFGYGASVDDDREKLQYDLYYIKHRSIGLDLSILLKTVSTILRFEGR